MTPASSDNLVLQRRVTLPSSGKEVAIVSLNRPEKKNCFNTELCLELALVFRSLQAATHLVAVIFTGEGSSFCAGADLANPPDPLKQSSDLPQDLFNNPVHQMSKLQTPIIAALSGYVVTGGFELALACDVLVGDSTVVFRDTHCKFSLAPCWGLSQRLQRRIGIGRAKIVSLGAVSISAPLAYEWGLLDELVKTGADTSVLDRALKIADAIGKNDATMVARYNRAIDEGRDMLLGNGLQRERQLGFAHYREMMEDGDILKNAKEFIIDENRPRSKL